jgi:hypothetical protein
MTTHDEIREVLRRAYQIEVDGYTFYSMTADKADKPAVQELFGKLADDEVEHKLYLKDVMGKFEADGVEAFNVAKRDPVLKSFTATIFSDDFRKQARGRRLRGRRAVHRHDPGEPGHQVLLWRRRQGRRRRGAGLSTPSSPTGRSSTWTPSSSSTTASARTSGPTAGSRRSRTATDGRECAAPRFAAARFTCSAEHVILVPRGARERAHR